MRNIGTQDEFQNSIAVYFPGNDNGIRRQNFKGKNWDFSLEFTQVFDIVAQL